MKKGFRRQGLTIAILCVLLMNVAAACDNATAVTNAIANSEIVRQLAATYASQEQAVLDLYTIGAISYTQYTTFSSRLRSEEASGLGTLGVALSQAEYTDPDATPDPSATPAPSSAPGGKKTHPYVNKIFEAMSYLASEPTEHGELSGTTSNAKVVEEYGSEYLPAYGGYSTCELIKGSGYPATFSKDVIRNNAAIPLEFWSDSEIKAICDSVNKLKNVRVFALAPAKTMPDLFQITSDLSARDEATLQRYYQSVADDYVISTKSDITPGAIYYVRDLEISNKTPKHGTIHTAILKVKTLDIAAIRGVLLGDDTAPLEKQNGVLIGNHLYITQYDVAVFRGFRRVPEDIEAGKDAKYAPVYTYQTVGKKAAYFDFAINAGKDVYAEPKTYLSSDRAIDDFVGSAVEELLIDFESGQIYRKGSLHGTSNSFMGLGSADALASVVVATTAFKRVNDERIEISPSSDVGAALRPKIKFQRGAGKTITPDQPLFVLVEYLEAVYSKGVMEGEPVVAYGRKIRLDDDMLKEKNIAPNTTVAYIVGASANATNWTDRATKSDYFGITLSDFLDIDGLYNGDGTVKNSPSDPPTGAAERLATVAAVTIPSDDRKTGEYSTGYPDTLRGDLLPKIAAGKGVECVIRLGSPMMAKSDDQRSNATATQTPLYVIPLSGGLYDRGLFNQWINATNNAPLEGWAKTAKALGYAHYDISGAVLTENLKGNYAFELSQDGLLSLDLDTMIDISRQNEEDRRGYGVMVLRTVLMILGFILITYCESFLTHKMLKNHGELPQFFVEDSHPAIISRETFDLVQDEVRRNSETGVGRNTTHIFSGRVICGVCGHFYGKKVWGSNTKYRRIVWRCNAKYQRADNTVHGAQCKSPHVTERQLEYAFITAFNEILSGKDNYFAEYETIVAEITDTAALDTEREKLNAESVETYELIKAAMDENARKALNQDEYERRFDELAAKYDRQKARLMELTEQRQSVLVRRERLNLFLAELAKRDEVLTDFDKTLFVATVEKMTVNSESNVAVRFRDGTEISVDVAKS